MKMTMLPRDLLRERINSLGGYVHEGGEGHRPRRRHAIIRCCDSTQAFASVF